jgi:hypothetical protein
MLSLLSELEHDRWPGQEPSTTSIRPPRLFSFVLMPSQQSEIDQMKAKLKALDR